jgi:hypothetical protein
VLPHFRPSLSLPQPGRHLCWGSYLRSSGRQLYPSYIADFFHPQGARSGADWLLPNYAYNHFATMTSLTLVVPDPPPIREHPGRSADRRSPHAASLAAAGQSALEAEGHGAFAIEGMVVLFGQTMWDTRAFGYDPAMVLVEVLTDVGAIWETGGWWSYMAQDPGADFYVVTFTDRRAISRPTPGKFKFTEIPNELRRPPGSRKP